VEAVVRLLYYSRRGQTTGGRFSMTSQSDSTTSRPRAFQFCIATLLVVMAWVGLVSLGLRMPTAASNAALALATLLFLFTAVLVAVYRPGKTRAHAIGFAVFCGGFLGCSVMFPGYGLPFTGSQLFDSLLKMLHPDWAAWPTLGSRTSAQQETFMDFESICNHAIACFMGLVGSIIAQFLYATQHLQPPGK